MRTAAKDPCSTDNGTRHASKPATEPSHPCEAPAAGSAINLTPTPGEQNDVASKEAGRTGQRRGDPTIDDRTQGEWTASDWRESVSPGAISTRPRVPDPRDVNPHKTGSEFLSALAVGAIRPHGAGSIAVGTPGIDDSRRGRDMSHVWSAVARPGEMEWIGQAIRRIAIGPGAASPSCSVNEYAIFAESPALEEQADVATVDAWAAPSALARFGVVAATDDPFAPSVDSVATTDDLFAASAGSIATTPGFNAMSSGFRCDAPASRIVTGAPELMAESPESEVGGFACDEPSFALNLHTMLYHAISQA